MARNLETSTMSTSGIKTEYTDKNLDNLARQGFEDPNRRTCQLKSSLGKQTRNKIHLDMHPTDPQNDINGTGNYELKQTGRSDQSPTVHDAIHDSKQYHTPL